MLATASIKLMVLTWRLPYLFLDVTPWGWSQGLSIRLSSTWLNSRVFVKRKWLRERRKQAIRRGRERESQCPEDYIHQDADRKGQSGGDLEKQSKSGLVSWSEAATLWALSEQVGHSSFPLGSSAQDKHWLESCRSQSIAMVNARDRLSEAPGNSHQHWVLPGYFCSKHDARGWKREFHAK